MNISKFGPPEINGPNLDCDIYFTLNKPEVDGLSSPTTQAAITAVLAPGAPPFGAIAAAIILSYIDTMKQKSGPNGVSVKCTVRQVGGVAPQMKEFIAEPL
ncbi:hypothetical protein AB2M95_05775 [Pseudomonas chlororaphis]|uniref:hypothetical protein n=1 Tax=Pseudomonas chlororaphis TaxID=587753 RepID=UPI003462DF6B